MCAEDEWFGHWRVGFQAWQTKNKCPYIETGLGMISKTSYVFEVADNVSREAPKEQETQIY